MKIKKGWKITGISLGSLLGVVLLAVGVAMWVLLTPSQLTKLVNRLSGKFLNCDAHFEYVELTLLSTFPDAELKIKNVTLVNPMEGAPDDTLAFIGDVTIGIDLMAYLTDDELIVHQVYVDNTKANLYIDKEGRCNFDIIPPSSDTTEGKPLELIDLKKVAVKNLTVSLKNDRDGVEAEVCDLDMSMEGRIRRDDIKGRLQSDFSKASLVTKDATGREVMVAELERMNLGADIDKQGSFIDATTMMNGNKVALTLKDSTGMPTLATVLDGFSMNLTGGNGSTSIEGVLALKVGNGTFDMSDNSMVTKALQESTAPLLQTRIPFHYNHISGNLSLDESAVDIADAKFLLNGSVDMGSSPAMDLTLRSVGKCSLAQLLSFIPDAYASFCKGMDADGNVLLGVKAVGPMGDGMMPVLEADVNLTGGRLYWPKVLPYRFSGMYGNVTTHLDFNEGGPCVVKVKNLKARTKDNSRIMLAGRIDDLLKRMRFDATLTGSLPLSELKPWLPEEMNVEIAGNADVGLQTAFALDDLLAKDFGKMKASAKMKVTGIDVDNDSIYSVMPGLDIDIAVPAIQHTGKLADVHIVGIDEGECIVESGVWKVKSRNDKLDISLGVNNMFRENLQADYEITVGETDATFDSTFVSTGGASLKGVLDCHPSHEDILRQLNPRFSFSTHSASLFMPQMPEALCLTDFDVRYKPEKLEILSAQVMMGHTDLDLFGQVENLEQWVAGESMLKGYLNLSSEYSDVDQMMRLFSGAGSDADSLEAMRIEDTVPEEATPFIVPKNVDITLMTHVNRCLAFGNDLHDVSGELTVKDGVAVLDQMGFICKAARMQLTAIYKSPRPNNLFTSVDFHLLDIQIDELLDMIPCVDTLVPMLKAFNGNANFHLAGETFLDAYYQPKMSSLLGSAAISGKDLVVFEDKSIAQTAKLIGLKSWKDDDNKIKVDSLSVEMTCFRKEIEVYPFLLNMGKYSFCISGVHTLDNLCNYHIELLKNPLIAKIGVDIKGSLSDPKISLGSVRYGDFYKPEKKNAASKKALELKAMIRRELERNVK